MKSPGSITRRLLAVFLGIWSLCVAVQADEIVVYGGEAFPPQSYLKNGKPAGIMPAVFARIAKDTGDTYTLILLPWKRAMSESNAGHGGISNFSMTRERALQFDYSDYIYANRVYLLTLKGHTFPFKTLNDLKGKRIGIALGSSYGDTFDQAVRDHLFDVDYDTNQVLRFKKLLAGRFDGALAGFDSYNRTLHGDLDLYANRDKFIVNPNPVVEDRLYLAFPKSMRMQPALRRFNQALAGLKKSKELQRIIDENSQADE